jgi:hypothetical protein
MRSRMALIVCVMFAFAVVAIEPFIGTSGAVVSQARAGHPHNETLPPNAHAVYIIHLPTTTSSDTPEIPTQLYTAKLRYFYNQVNMYRLYTAITQQEQAAAAAQAAQAQVASYTPPTPVATEPSSCGYPVVPGALTGCMWQCIEMAESTDTPSDTSGLYGDLISTWNGYGGYATAGAAPISVQNDFNAALQAKDGWAPWNDSCTGR